MSYILDALRKAEHERHLGQAPTLASPSLPQKPVQRRLWFGLALIGFGLNAALLTALFLNRTPSPPIPAVANIAPLPVIKPAEPPLAETATPVAVVDTPRAATPMVEAAVQLPLATEKVTKPVETIIALPMHPTSVARESHQTSIPLLETLTAAERRGIPEMNLDIHVYSADTDERFVVINGLRYREGEQLREGAILQAVTVNGVILRQGKQRFKLAIRR